VLRAMTGLEDMLGFEARADVAMLASS